MKRHIGTIIRHLRSKRDMSQDALAEACGVSRVMVNLIESGRRQPTVSVAERILHALKAKLEVRYVEEDPRIARRGNGVDRGGARRRHRAVETVVVIGPAPKPDHAAKL